MILFNKFGWQSTSLFPINLDGIFIFNKFGWQIINLKLYKHIFLINNIIQWVLNLLRN